MKKYLKIIISIFIYVNVILLLFPNPAFAYLDPGTGSYIIQIIIGALVGTLFALKMYWKKIATLASNLFSKTENSKKK